MFDEYIDPILSESSSSRSLSSMSSDGLSAELDTQSVKHINENGDDSSETEETHIDQSLTDMFPSVLSSSDNKSKKRDKKEKREKKGRKGSSFIKSTTSIFSFSSTEAKFRKFSSTLEKVLQSFESIQEWADITSFLLKFNKASTQPFINA